jgi:hypothetical protein
MHIHGQHKLVLSSNTLLCDIGRSLSQFYAILLFELKEDKRLISLVEQALANQALSRHFFVWLSLILALSYLLVT